MFNGFISAVFILIQSNNGLWADQCQFEMSANRVGGCVKSLD